MTEQAPHAIILAQQVQIERQAEEIKELTLLLQLSRARDEYPSASWPSVWRLDDTTTLILAQQVQIERQAEEIKELTLLLLLSQAREARDEYPPRGPRVWRFHDTTTLTLHSYLSASLPHVTRLGDTILTHHNPAGGYYYYF